jgi:hypothetical protein
MPEWTADVTNDPDKDYRLCVDIYEDDVHKARIEKNSAGALVLRVYENAKDLTIPLHWLAGIIARAQNELAGSDS